MRTLSLLLAAAGCAAEVLTGPLQARQPDQASQRFEFSASGERRESWSVAGLRRWYAKEQLPALFSRTLTLDGPLPAGSSLEWIFTGPEGGVTVRLEPGRARLIQRYYDSFGHSAANPPKARYPERVWEQSEASLREPVRSVEVVMDHRLAAVVRINGKEALRQRCLLEVRRHQLAWTPAMGDASGQVTGGITAPQAVNAVVRVDASKRRQSIYGFGGILSVAAFRSLSEEGKQRWWRLIQEYNLLIHREYPNGDRLKPDLSNFDRPEDATPHYYGDNFPNGEISDFDYLRQFRKKGGKVLFQFWDLPRWAKREYATADGKKWPRAPIVDEYVRAMVGYCRISKERTGAPPEVVGIQNEVVQPAEVWHEMILRLRAGLDAAGFQAVRIHMPDNSTLAGGIDTALSIRKSPEAWRRIDWAATHVYDYQKYFDDPDGYDAVIERWRQAAEGRPFLSTEFTINSGAYQTGSYRVALAMGQLYHKNMALMDASALIYCWNLLDVEQPSFAATRSLFGVDRTRGWIPVPSSHQLRVFGAYSRRLKEGMVRVDADAADGLLATAYEGKNGEKTLVVINRSTAPVRLKVEWSGVKLVEEERASPALENAVRQASADPLVEPGEILTLTSVRLGSGG